MTLDTTHILKENIYFHTIYTQYNGHFPKLGGVFLYTFPFPFLEVVLADPLVLFIHNRIELGPDDCFKHLPLGYWGIKLQLKCLCVSFPPS